MQSGMVELPGVGRVVVVLDKVPVVGKLAVDRVVIGGERSDARERVVVGVVLVEVRHGWRRALLEAARRRARAVVLDEKVGAP
eukprot:5064560-Prymnesium_polylepis.3